MNTSLPGYSMRVKADLPPLAYYRSKDQYVPEYGDIIIWTKLFTTWHGVVSDYDGDDKLTVIFAGVPYLLFTMQPEDTDNEKRQLSLAEIKKARNGKYAIQQFDKKASQNVWYV